jgi:DNA-binding NtrC family response regulator
MNNIDKIRRSVGMIGESDQIIEMLSLISQVAITDISILISGESGSGKDVVARAIHKNSKRKFESLIIVNCAAIPSGIIESELFGHKKGSFTGAIENKKGYFEEANKGSIFLDEIGELSKETQAKLLRVIESGEFIRVGESKSQKTDVRIIAATNRNLKDEVNKNNFRQDLYFRLKTINIKGPALCDHLSDLHLYVERFGLEFTNKNDIPFKGFSSEAISILKQYHWPGNIRELKNVVESLLVINKGERISDAMVCKALNLEKENENNDLPVSLGKDSDRLERELILKQLLYLRQDINELKTILLKDKYGEFNKTEPSNPALFLPNHNTSKEVNIEKGEHKNVEDAGISGLKEEAVGEMTMNELEKEVIEKYLIKFKNNRRKTANALNISERTLYRKLKEYEIK